MYIAYRSVSVKDIDLMAVYVTWRLNELKDELRKRQVKIRLNCICWAGAPKNQIPVSEACLAAIRQAAYHIPTMCCIMHIKLYCYGNLRIPGICDSSVIP